MQAEGYAFFRTIEPFIAQANNQSAAQVKAVLYPGNPVPPNTLSVVSWQPCKRHLRMLLQFKPALHASICYTTYTNLLYH